MNINLNHIEGVIKTDTPGHPLTYGHPDKISYNGTGYLYYLYPVSSVFSTPKFFVGGQDQSAGFTKLDGTLRLNGGAVSDSGGFEFNVYRSNQEQTGSLTIDLK